MPSFDGDYFISRQLIPMSFSDMKNAVIGVQATEYLKHMIREPPAQEPLLAALGGEPIALKYYIGEELDRWKQSEMRPLFIFDGQSIVGKEDMALRTSMAALERTKKAWTLYGENEPSEAVKTFGTSGATRPEEVCGILREVLLERGLEFMVASHSACAQLAYLDTLDEQYIDGIMGSQELLLYEINDGIICPPSSADWEARSFQGFIKSDLIKKLNVSPEIVTDALLMIGTSFLPPFPPLEDAHITSTQPWTINEAINMLRASSKSITTACTAFSDILQEKDPNWLDKFRKARMAIKHCQTIRESGAVHIQDYEHLTSDNVEYLGLQLPSELHYYLTKAVVGPRLMNCFASLEFLIYPTLDGVLSDEYRRLVTEALPPIKTTTAALISSRIHRGFQYKNINMRFWFNSPKQELVHRTEQPHTNQKVDTWGVKEAELKVQESSISSQAGSLSFALLSLQDKDFSKKTISKSVTGLNSEHEVVSNAIWRLLHLRGYINDQHELTSWGNALATTIKSIGPIVKKYDDIHHVQEAAFIAYELLRFDSLNSRNRHTELIGGPLRGSDEDKANCILIGRTACLLKVRHKNIGYTGPLSQNFLSFHSIIKAVRETDRDLLEAITASMFLASQINRDILEKCNIVLPFATDINIGLGIAVKTYLDDYFKVDTPQAEREAIKQGYASKFLPNSVNIAEDLDVAFDFFNALHEGVKSLGDEIPKADKQAWDDAKEYLARRR